MPKKVTANNAANNNYGVPEKFINPVLKKKLSQRTCQYYAENPDMLPNKMNWLLNSDELKEMVKDDLSNRNFRYTLEKLGILNKVDESIFLYLPAHNNFEEFMQQMPAFKYAVWKKNAVITAADRKHMNDHLGDLYYAAKLDAEQKEDTLKFLNDPNRDVITEMNTTHNMGMDAAALKRNADVFAVYRKMLTACIEEMATTDSAYFNSKSYTKLKEKLDAFDEDWRRTMDVVRDREELRLKVRKFGRILSEINTACDAYVEEHQPKKGKTYKNLKLSNTQMKRLSVIAEIQQLHTLFYTENSDHSPDYVFAENRNPASAEFSRQSAALKMLTQTARQNVEHGIGKETEKNTFKNREYCRKVLFNDQGCRDAEIDGMMQKGCMFEKRCNQLFDKYKNKYGNDSETAAFFYADLRTMSGKKLLGEFADKNFAVEGLNHPQIGEPILY